jgi:GT2 family glycosyltransferase
MIGAIIVNYRTPDATVRAARSLGDIDRLFIVDNGSDDGSLDRLRAELRDAAILATGRNLGFSGGSNAGIAAALAGGADRLLLVNSDVELAADGVGRLARALDQHPHLGIVGPALLDDGGRIESLGLSFSRLSGRVWNLGAGQPADRLRPWPRPRPVDGVTGCVMLIRRAVVDEVGRFDERYFYALEDLDLCLRAAQRGFGTACVETATARHAGSLTIGPRSPRRLYFAARNHLLLARRAPLPAPLALARDGAIVARHLAHALVTAPAPRLAGLRAVARGVVHHLRGRYGEGS